MNLFFLFYNITDKKINKIERIIENNFNLTIHILYEQKAFMEIFNDKIDIYVRGL